MILLFEFFQFSPRTSTMPSIITPLASLTNAMVGCLRKSTAPTNTAVASLPWGSFFSSSALWYVSSIFVPSPVSGCKKKSKKKCKNFSFKKKIEKKNKIEKKIEKINLIRSCGRSPRSSCLPLSLGEREWLWSMLTTLKVAGRQ